MNEYVITVAVITHGTIIDMNMNPERQGNFDPTNTKVFSMAGDFNTVMGGNDFFINTHEYLNKEFRKDLLSTEEVLNNYVKRGKPKYKSWIKSIQNTTDVGIDTTNAFKIMNTMTADKILYNPEERKKGFLDYFNLNSATEKDYMGIYVISVHKRRDDTLELIYPLDSHANKEINITKIPDIYELSEYIHGDNMEIEKKIDDLLSINNCVQPYPNIDNLEMAKYFKDNSYDYLINKESIAYMRMSYLMKLLRTIMGKKDNFINLLDYSCSHIKNIVSKEEQDKYSRYYKEAEEDEENRGPIVGGKRKKRTSRKNKKCSKKQKKQKLTKRKKIR